jgi:hypothetical protein
VPPKEVDKAWACRISSSLGDDEEESSTMSIFRPRSGGSPTGVGDKERTLPRSTIPLVIDVGVQDRRMASLINFMGALAPKPLVPSAQVRTTSFRMPGIEAHWAVFSMKASNIGGSSSSSDLHVRTFDL